MLRTALTGDTENLVRIKNNMDFVKNQDVSAKEQRYKSEIFKLLTKGLVWLQTFILAKQETHLKTKVN